MTQGTSTAATTKPMATSSSSATVVGSDHGSPFGGTSVMRRTRKEARRLSYNPTITAMLTGRTMDSCDDVRKMNAQCLATHSDASICQTAAHYMSVCVTGGQQS